MTGNHLNDNQQEPEILLTGGRITEGVVKKGNCVLRPLKPNSEQVHRVLIYLEEMGVEGVPRFRGIDSKGREILSFLEGESPDELGFYTVEQCAQAARFIHRLHDVLKSFPDCGSGQTVCHNDLSPCNFVFLNGNPIGVIDWDTVIIGDPLDDLAYAIWLWLDIGNEDYTPPEIARRMEMMLDSYRVPIIKRGGFADRIIHQMHRVGKGIFPTEEQAERTRQWTRHCENWFQANLRDFSQFR